MPSAAPALYKEIGSNYSDVSERNLNDCQMPNETRQDQGGTKACLLARAACTAFVRVRSKWRCPELQVLVLPTFRSAVRNRTSEMSAKGLYGTGRSGLASEVVFVSCLI